MRIISGEKKGKKLLTLEGDDVRPTTDRVKESLFSIIQFSISGRNFLDLFAGSGQIGLEALSRGAKSATLVDSSKKSIEICQKNIKELNYSDKAKLITANSISFLSSNNETFDLAFLDPPYRKGLIAQAMPQLVESMNKGGTIICEHPFDEKLQEEYGNFKIFKTYKYGKISLSLYRHKELIEVN